MSLDGHSDPMQSAATLVVADWAVDPQTVVTTCAARGRSSAIHLVVPAWLHGIDWAGDPFASVPCARRQLERIIELCATAGLRPAPRPPRRRLLAGSHCAPATHGIG